MPWDIDGGDLNPSVRYYWDEDAKEEDKEWIEIRLASDDDNRDLFKKVGVKEKKELRENPKTRQMQWIRDFDPTEKQREEFDEESWDFTITNWRLLKKKRSDDDFAEEIPCTKANKVMLMRKAPKFSIFYGECMEKLREGVKSRKEDVTKN